MAELQPMNPNQQNNYGQQQQYPYPVQQSGGYYQPQQQTPYPPTTSHYFQPPIQQAQQQQQLNMEQSGYDPESNNNTEFEFSDESIRKGFIRKVFAILSVQLAITLGVISLFVFHKPTIQFVANNIWLWWASLIMVFVIMIVLACCEGLRRKSPINFILLFLFTACMSLMLGVTSASFSIYEVMLAVGITTAVTVGLTIFALQTKWDFTTMGSILFVGVIVLLIFGIFAAIFRDQILTLVYASLGALLFCFYLVYDIQLMMGGKHKYSISPEEYIFAALNLYTDIINIFMYILMIISASRN
ncbi:hypothetical protein PVAND_011323 [Polypedilum vanderplanki]|uniref:Uncharacterized protein n=1 Tax=Polypedilum vanderplanki TaxID=319348 RepID=A0A9J6CJ69_POLVA|nr:hypothetical protein PVAND_011323 [Polypedilum vanderplanki]